MLTSFGTKKELQKPLQNSEHAKAFTILGKALNGILKENTHRVYIDDSSYRADFKLPVGMDLVALQQALQNQKLQFSEKKTVDESIVVHTYKLLPALDKLIEVWYQPISRPRM